MHNVTIASAVRISVVFLLMLPLPGCAKAKQPKGKLLFYGERAVDQPKQTYMWEDGKIRPFHRTGYCTFSNKGDRIACSDAAEKRILLLDLDGNEIGDYVVGERASQIRWSFDDKYLFYVYNNLVKGNNIDIIKRIDLQSGGIGEVFRTKNNDDISSLMTSPRGHKIIFDLLSDNKDTDGFYLINYELQDPIAKQIYAEWSMGRIWYPDGKHIGLLIEWDKDEPGVKKGATVLAKINIKTGNKEIIKVITPKDMLNFDPISITRDGKYYIVIERKEKAVMGSGTRVVFWDTKNPNKKIPMTDCIYFKLTNQWSTASMPDWLPAD